MSGTPSYTTFVLEQLARATSGVRGRSMFGGVGIYSNETFFALIADDIVYFKVDESNRGDFEARGKGPFRPMGPDGMVMQYYALPEDVLEDIEALRLWVGKALTAARRKLATRPRRRP